MESTEYIVVYAGDFAFQVRGFYMKRYVVDLKAKKCACNLWSVSGVLCPHAIACIMQRGLQIFYFVHESLSKVQQLLAVIRE